jgi:glycosyltransferase involved in cell wall biosynthesis
MNHKIKVTIGLCVKNAEQTIKDALQSILEQDFPPQFMELIVVDGYSKDNTLSIIRTELIKAHIKFQIFYENIGLGYARQIVVENALGDFIIWVDSDMILPKDFVRKQIEFMENNPRVGIAKGRYHLLKQNSLVAALEDIEFVVTFRGEREASFEPLGTSGCIYRVKAIRDVGGFDLNLKGVGEDMDAEYRIRNAGWKLYISPAFFYERRRSTWQALWKEYFWHGKGIFYFFRKNKIIKPYRLFPVALLLKKVVQITYAYKLTRQKKVLLLPLHYIFKRTAWFLGYILEYSRWIIS